MKPKNRVDIIINRKNGHLTNEHRFGGGLMLPPPSNTKARDPEAGIIRHKIEDHDEDKRLKDELKEEWE